MKSNDFETLLKRIMTLEADLEKTNAKLDNEIFKFNALRGRVSRMLEKEIPEEEDLNTDDGLNELRKLSKDGATSSRSDQSPF